MDKIKNFQRKLAKLPALIFAGIYISLIPIFAIIYLFFPNQFYHSTVQYENSMRVLEDDLSNSLERVIFENARTNDRISFKDTYLLENSIDIKSIDIDNKYLVLDTVLTFYFETGEFLYAKHSCKIYISVEGLEVMDGAKVDTTRFHNVVVDSNEFNQTGLQTLFSVKNASLQNGTLLIELDDKIKGKIMKYYRGMKGLPTGIIDNLGRMLYLSSVTITTLGYGDIVPLTSWTRLFVGLESVLGIVVIGLFLNSLTEK